MREERIDRPGPIPTFTADNSARHLRTLRERLKQKLKENPKSRAYLVQLKAVLFPLLYVALLLFTYNSYPNKWIFYLGYFVLGLFMVVIFLTIIHEASHENIFDKKWLNRLFLYFFDIMGANSYIWQKRHRLMHHNYPNINGWDTDIEQSDLFRICPTAPKTKVHNYQQYLIFILYPLYLFNWLIIRDFKDFFSTNSTIKKRVKIPWMEYVKLFLFKAFYLFYMFLVPIYFFEIPFITVFFGFITLTFTASVFSLLVLLPPHANIENEFPIISAELEVPSTWLEHQLKTTNDITGHNWFISFFMGNYNYHIAHHIFPNIGYTDLELATEVIEEYAEENNLTYKKFTLIQSLKNHYELVKRNAMEHSIFNETF